MTKKSITGRRLRSARVAFFSVTLGLFSGFSAAAQTPVALDDLSAFKSPGANWQISGDVTADLEQPNTLRTSKGKGILVNIPDKKNHGVDLYSNQTFSDLDLELDYMMAKGSNSGIYLQGRYELQLLDSWGSRGIMPGDNGGIYERWDEKRGKGNEGFDGHPPRQNVSRAPGLWQHLKVSFQAPRFNSSGQKTANARIISVVLNGVLIHDNVELQGPTRGAMDTIEAADGPLRIQGDHGAVAFRNIVVKNYNTQRPELTNLQYRVYSGNFEKLPNFSSLKAEAEGSSTLLTSAVSKKDNEFLIRYTGTLNVKQAGEYVFKYETSGGTGALKINNQEVRKFGETDTKPVTLPAGAVPFELVYSKVVSWQGSSLGLLVSGPQIREFLISDPNTINTDVADPILMTASENTVLRSFMDIPGGTRIVHAVNVGSPRQLHYTYDLDRGMLLQAWRGEFLDATPMWHDRGDGSSRPLGSRLYFGAPGFTVQKLADPQSPWSNDTSTTGFVTRGYELDVQNNPSFVYHIYGAKVRDAIQVAEEGRALKRTISIENAPAGMFVRLAGGKSVENISKGMYQVDDKTYYIRIDDAAGANPVIRDAGGNKELLMPIQNGLSYSILF